MRWRRVHDGDTLVLEDGRRVRLIGVNSPEVSSRGPGDPFADEATRAAQNFLAGSPSVLLLPGAETWDRYGRLLAHVFRPADGASLAAELIARGLAWQIAVPPNLAYLECNRAAEHQARVAARGVWSSQYLKPTMLAGCNRAFECSMPALSGWCIRKTGGWKPMAVLCCEYNPWISTCLSAVQWRLGQERG